VDLVRIVLIVVFLSTGFAPASLLPSDASAQDQGRGFVDLYFGGSHFFKSDVPTWDFDDTEPIVGGRLGFWLGQNLGLTLRTWYLQTDAKEEGGLSGSDLSFVGVALELLARWPVSDRWALYGSLGPAFAVTTLDRQFDPAVRKKEDARSVAVGASGSAGVEYGIVKQLRAFAEVQSSLMYPSFEFSDRTISPSLLNVYGLVGVRLAF
jgi:outer membrane protein with beta-barrel domain